MEYIIEVKDLTKKFGGFYALKGISFNIKEGEIFALLGRNGAGKTVTMKILTAQLTPTRGMVKVCGYNPVKEPLNIHKIIGFLPEEQNLYIRLSAFENLKLFAKLYDVPLRRVWELLELFNLKEWAHKKVKNFSFGMKQKLMLARAMLTNPKILFLDEPSNGLDPIAMNEMDEIIKELNKKGITIFLSTHYIEEAENIAHRVAIIEEGEIIEDNTPAEIKKKTGKSTLKDAFIFLTGKNIK